MSRFFALVGPGGVGKDTVIRRVARSQGMKLGISATTRPPRPGEENGHAYWFLTRDQYQMMLEDNKFIEHDEHLGNGYALPWSEWDFAQRAGLDLIVILDVNGLQQAKQVIPGIVSIFLLPGEEGELEQRMRLRGDTEEAIRLRLERSKYEMGFAHTFDYLVYNSNGPIGLRDAVKRVEEIVQLERNRKQAV